MLPNSPPQKMLAIAHAASPWLGKLRPVGQNHLNRLDPCDPPPRVGGVFCFRKFSDSMQLIHVVRFGTLGHLGRFTSVNQESLPRGSRVVLRTTRGIETGEVLLSEKAPSSDDGSFVDGSLLRAMSIDDELLETRLQQNRLAAIEQCAQRIAELELPVSLVDVEPLFDGQTLVFYFLGEATSAIERLVEELTETYETQVQFRRFSRTLDEGCGPDCGTGESTGCGSCAEGGCSLAGACSNATR